MKDQFINIRFKNDSLDIYYIRTAILKALTNALPNLDGKLLDIGCGKMPYKEYILTNSKVTEYIGLDIETALIYDKNVTPDFTWDGKTMPFKENSFGCAIGTEVLEHCPQPEMVLKEVFRVLKPGGIFFFTVPFLWNLHEVPNDEYRYTPFSLQRHLDNSGFCNINLSATGGWHAAMAQMMGLWLRRSGISRSKTKVLSPLFKPMIKYLIKIDKPATTFKNGQMITGLSGTAIKPNL